MTAPINDASGYDSAKRIMCVVSHVTAAFVLIFAGYRLRQWLSLRAKSILWKRYAEQGNEHRYNYDLLLTHHQIRFWADIIRNVHSVSSLYKFLFEYFYKLYRGEPT